MVCYIRTYYQESFSHSILMTPRAFILTWIILVQYILYCQHLLEMSIHRSLFIKCFQNIKDVLTQNKNEEQSNMYFMVTENEDPKGYPKSVILKRLNDMYMSLVWNYRYLTTFLQPTMLFIWIVIHSGLYDFNFLCVITCLSWGNRKRSVIRN